MLILLSPAKTLDEKPVTISGHTEPRLLPACEKLVETLRQHAAADLQALMGISEKLAQQNAQRYQSFCTPFTAQNAKPAILMFKGDVYTGLTATTFTEDDLAFAQDHLRILSGLYGLLRPLDLIQPYRLEMGTRLAQNGTKNLYEFWGNRITDLVNEDLARSGSTTILNLASQEYYKSLASDQLAGDVLTIHFKEKRQGNYKMITFNAKKARGRMAHLVVKERITDRSALKDLVVNDYVYNPALSTDSEWHYTID